MITVYTPEAWEAAKLRAAPHFAVAHPLYACVLNRAASRAGGQPAYRAIASGWGIPEAQALSMIKDAAAALLKAVEAELSANG